MSEKLARKNNEGVWERHSLQWRHVGPPLKPCLEDGYFMLAGIEPILQLRKGRVVVGVLGVTPEIINLSWPSNCELIAFDGSRAMISALWKRNGNIKSDVVEAFWNKLPIDEGYLHAVAGDGSLNALPSISEYSSILSEASRVLNDEGRVILRIFVRPNQQDDLQKIIDGIKDKTISTFHALKWLLAMHLSDAKSCSVQVSEIYKMFNSVFLDRYKLSKHTNWPIEEINTIDAYKNSATVYSFPSKLLLEAELKKYFQIEKIYFGTYYLSDRFPTYVLKKEVKK